MNVVKSVAVGVMILVGLAACSSTSEPAGEGSANRSPSGNGSTGDPQLPSGCPAQEPAGQECSDQTLSCTYGTETCCGETFAKKSCRCLNGKWSCLYVDACLARAVCPDAGSDAVSPNACPTERPTPGSTCAGSSLCTYGQETCCGETHPSTCCNCIQGVWACGYTDACLAGCPDAASGDGN